MSDERRPLRAISQPIGEGTFSGISMTAVPLVINAATAEEAQAKVMAVATEIRELLEAHDGVRLSQGFPETLATLEVAITVARNHARAIEAAVAERARNQ